MYYSSSQKGFENTIQYVAKYLLQGMRPYIILLINFSTKEKYFEVPHPL